MKQGFVLVTALSVAALVLILGLSSSFMAQSTLEVATNLRQATEARFAAEGGIDKAAAQLGLRWDCTGAVNSSVGNYSLSTSRSAMGVGQCALRTIAVGTGNRPSSFRSSAVVQAQSQAPNLSTAVNLEAAARATAACQQPLGSSEANRQGFNYARLKAAYLPTSPGDYTFYPQVTGRDLIVRTQAEANSLFPPGSRVRITGANLRFEYQENIILNNVTIVVEGFDLRVSRPSGSTGTFSLSGARLAANRFRFGTPAPVIQDSRLFVEDSLTLGSSADGLPQIRQGSTTIAVRGNLEVAVASGTAYNQDPVGFAALACGTLTHRSSQNLDGIYRAEGKLVWNGTGRLRGSASASYLETLRHLRLDPANELFNPDFADWQTQVIRAAIISRK